MGGEVELMSPHLKGYPRVYLGRHHPYANKSGVVEVHRWVMQRHLGRRLLPYEHCHHANGDKQSVKVEDLKVLESVEHGQYHYDRNFTRDRRGRLVWVKCGEEWTSEELSKR